MKPNGALDRGRDAWSIDVPRMPGHAVEDVTVWLESIGHLAGRRVVSKMGSHIIWKRHQRAASVDWDAIQGKRSRKRLKPNQGVNAVDAVLKNAVVSAQDKTATLGQQVFVVVFGQPLYLRLANVPSSTTKLSERRR